MFAPPLFMQIFSWCTITHGCLFVFAPPLFMEIFLYSVVHLRFFRFRIYIHHTIDVATMLFIDLSNAHF